MHIQHANITNGSNTTNQITVMKGTNSLMTNKPLITTISIPVSSEVILKSESLVGKKKFELLYIRVLLVLLYN